MFRAQFLIFINIGLILQLGLISGVNQQKLKKVECLQQVSEINLMINRFILK